jgi:hypothetical protein
VPSIDLLTVIAKKADDSPHVLGTAIVLSNASHKENNWRFFLTGYANQRTIHSGYNIKQEAEMHPFLQAQLAALHETDLKADAARGRGRSGSAKATDGHADGPPADVVIRRTSASDGPTLAALAELDSAPLPLGPALVAEVAGAPVAVLPLDGGRAFGDPFERTNELMALLELRAAQIRRDGQATHERHGLLHWAAPAALRRFI